MEMVKSGYFQYFPLLLYLVLFDSMLTLLEYTATSCSRSVTVTVSRLTPESSRQSCEVRLRTAQLRLSSSGAEAELEQREEQRPSQTVQTASPPPS